MFFFFWKSSIWLGNANLIMQNFTIYNRKDKRATRIRIKTEGLAYNVRANYNSIFFLPSKIISGRLPVMDNNWNFSTNSVGVYNADARSIINALWRIILRGNLFTMCIVMGGICMYYDEVEMKKNFDFWR